MSQPSSHAVAAQWARIGVLFNVPPARRTPDLERLLIETAGRIPGDPRLFVMAATWLSRYARLVARHRFCAMLSGVDDSILATLGLLLDTVRTMGRTNVLDTVVSACRPMPAAMPLFTVDRSSPAMAELARRRASKLSRRWHLWAEPIELRHDSLRPMDWIMEKNASFQARAVFAGGLRASIMACLEFDPATASEAALARRCGVTRKAMHEALNHLVFCNLVKRIREGRGYVVSPVASSSLRKAS